MIKNKLIGILQQAVNEAQQSGRLPRVTLPEITIEHPQNRSYGDYASSFPLRLARASGVNPLKIAEHIIARIPALPEIAEVKTAAPGFINFKLNSQWLAQQADIFRQMGNGVGNLSIGKGQKVQIEFVSVNPTGPLHIGHGRGAVLGSTLTNVLRAAGYDITAEYYVNDAGTQIDTFCRSLLARYLQALGRDAQVPSDGYQGAYLIELAEKIVGEKSDIFAKMPDIESLNELRKLGLEYMLNMIKSDLTALRVNFDVWFSESSLFEGGQYQRVMNILKEKGYISEKEGATWFVSSGLGEDKDNVLIRSAGTPTYFASDCAYHYNKFIERGFERVIDIWGADHQGHIPRMKAAVSTLGIDPERLEVIITQMVMLRRGEEEVKFSKRAGDIILLKELVDEAGADACRFFFLSRAASSQMEFDLELAKKESAENPVYYVQYAHARIASILRLANEKGIDYSDGDVSLIKTEPELDLIRKMIELPEVIEVVATTLEPHHLPYYAQELATVFHAFYKECRVISEDEALSKARLKLVEAAKLILGKTLQLMGMTAPESM